MSFNFVKEEELHGANYLSFAHEQTNMRMLVAFKKPFSLWTAHIWFVCILRI